MILGAVARYIWGERLQLQFADKFSPKLTLLAFSEPTCLTWMLRLSPATGHVPGDWALSDEQCGFIPF